MKEMCSLLGQTRITLVSLFKKLVNGRHGFMTQTFKHSSDGDDSITQNTKARPSFPVSFVSSDRSVSQQLLRLDNNTNNTMLLVINNIIELCLSDKTTLIY